uniref:Uncharacterized protein n=1 Tax=Rhizophora mucronata TaxID=61149 RepID=A0A2P2NQD0_RHIMU
MGKTIGSSLPILRKLGICTRFKSKFFFPFPQMFMFFSFSKFYILVRDAL